MGMMATVDAQVRINEVDPFGTLEDELGRGEDWIELHNEGEDPAFLGGLWLSDDPDDWQQWALPPVTMGPGEHLIVHASGRDAGTVDHWECPATAEQPWRYFVPEAPLSEDWRTLSFDDAAWMTGEGSIGFGDGDDATVVDGDVVFMRRTFAVTDVEALAQGWLAVDYDDGYVAFLNGREMARSATMEGQSVSHDTWALNGHEAVLYNGGIPEAVPFDPREWLQEGSNVLAVQVHNVEAGSSDLTARPYLALGRSVPAAIPFNGLPDWWAPGQPALHAAFKLRPGEPVILSDGEGNLVDLATLPVEMRAGITLGRDPGGEWCFFATATPSAPNGDDCGAFVAPTPIVEPSSGWYQPPILTVSATNGTLSGAPGQTLPPMVMRYTTDGSEPTAASPVFTGNWSTSSSAILSVRAFGEGVLPSATVDRTYLVGAPQNGLETVSIITHPDHLWDWNSGIYVAGPNAGPEYPFLGANFWQPWSRESRLEWFDATGEPVARSRFDLEIHGGWSRAEPQRSFRLDFKKKYTGPLEHAVFPSKSDITRFGNLNLRNGGQASWENKIQDAFYCELALEANVVASAWRPVEVYLNGEYWGVYGAREKSDEQFVEDNFGWDEEHVDMLNQWESLHGAPSAFEVSVAPLMQLPDGTSAFHSAFAGTFDVASYIDYHIFEIHGQNVDWMTAPWGLKNFKYFRSVQGDGLWRPIMFDMDACFGAWGTSPYENYLALSLDPPYPSIYSALLGKFLEDDDFACRFATRTCDLLSTAFEPVRFNTRLTQAAASIGSAMAHHIDRWSSPASMAYWEQRLQLMRDHNEARIGPERDQVRTQFGYSEPEEVTLNWSPPFAGEVQVNGMPGLGTGWSSLYFGECPIRLAAIPGPGYGFMGWQDNLHTDLGLLDPAVPFAEIELQGDDVFFAQFGNCLEGVTVVAAHQGDMLVGTVYGSGQPLSLTWYRDGLWMGQGSTMQPTVPGEYILTATGGGCTLFSDPIAWPDQGNGPVLTVAAFSASNADNSTLQASPNPASGPVVLSGTGGGDLMVLGSDGAVRHVESRVALPHVLDCSGWPAGVYAVILSEGAARRTARFVVQ